MDQRRSWLILSGFVFIGGLILSGFGFFSKQAQLSDKLGNSDRPTLEARKRQQTKPVPPKFDEWGNPLPQPEPKDETVAKSLGMQSL